MENDSQVKERLFELCDSLGISTNAFSINIGKNREFVRKITGEIGTDALRQIYRTYPNVNILWIITGEGEKFLVSDITAPNNENLTSYLKEENKTLKEEVRQLIKENAILSAKVELYSSNQTEAAG